MPDTYKVTFFLKYGSGGVSFSHFNQGDGYDACIKRGEDLAKRYLACCGTGVSLPYIRASREDIKGDSVISKKFFETISSTHAGSAGSSGVKVSYEDTPDAWWTSALLRLGGSPVARGFQFMRGVPDGMVILPGGIVQELNWSKALNAYFQQLEDDRWGMMAVDKTPGAAKKIKNIRVNNALPSVVFDTEGAHGFQVGDKIRISGIQPNVTNDNSIWLVATVPSTTSFTIDNPLHITPPQWGSYGQAWSLKKTFVPYLAKYCQPIRITSRKAGRPFDSLVGRRRRRTKR